MAGHAQLKFVMTECSKTQIRLTGLIWLYLVSCRKSIQLHVNEKVLPKTEFTKLKVLNLMKKTDIIYTGVVTSVTAL